MFKKDSATPGAEVATGAGASEGDPAVGTSKSDPTVGPSTGLPTAGARGSDPAKRTVRVPKGYRQLRGRILSPNTAERYKKEASQVLDNLRTEQHVDTRKEKSVFQATEATIFAKPNAAGDPNVFGKQGEKDPQAAQQHGTKQKVLSQGAKATFAAKLNAAGNSSIFEREMAPQCESQHVRTEGGKAPSNDSSEVKRERAMYEAAEGYVIDQLRK